MAEIPVYIRISTANLAINMMMMMVFSILI